MADMRVSNIRARKGVRVQIPPLVPTLKGVSLKETIMWLCFRLSMPNVGSWNGKWTGEGDFYAVVRSFKTKQSLEVAKLLKEYYHYDFGDGWAAGISITKVDLKEVRAIKKNTKGFCGYEWMIDSIVKNGKILNSDGEEGG